MSGNLEVENSGGASVIPDSQEKCSWVKFSASKLATLERKIFQVLKTAYRSWHVPIEHQGDKAKIWTVSMNTELKATPLVLLHGFGAGVGFWCLNLDSFAAHRPVYAIDLLGFGRSSRPDFSNDGLEAEKQFVESIESWRKEVNLDQFILLGHSLGAYLATSYTMTYPERVKHLILAEPWGFAEKTHANLNPSLWLRALIIMLYPFTIFNPLATVRAAGPFGPWLVRKMRSDISNKYAGRLEDHEIIIDYIYQCNSQYPSGESAFHRMMRGFGWAKSPMLSRMDDLHKDVSMTVLHGSDSWVDRTIGQKIKDLRQESYVRVAFCERAGHHIHADAPEDFNKLVVDACTAVDSEGKEKIKQNVNEKAVSEATSDSISSADVEL